MASHARRSQRFRSAHRRPSGPRLKHANPRILTTTLGVLAAFAVMLISSATARAAPSVSELEKQIDIAWNKLEPIIEQHNATRTQLDQTKAKVAALTKQIHPLQLQVDLQMAKVGDMAAHVYKGSQASALNALLSADSLETLTQQLELLDQVARAQQQEISGVADLKARYEEQKRPLDELVSQLTRTEAEQAAKEKEINAEIKRLQALRLQAYGTTGGTGSLRPVACPVNYPGGAAGTAVKFACSQIGKPYSWGADGPGSYDCSGLTMRAWNQAGVSMPHNAAAQRRAIPSVSRANLRPGDLVFYYSDLHHVGMYVGGDWIVHAPRAGDVVRMRSMTSAPIHSYGRPG